MQFLEDHPVGPFGELYVCESTKPLVRCKQTNFIKEYTSTMDTPEYKVNHNTSAKNSMSSLQKEIELSDAEVSSISISSSSVSIDKASVSLDSLVFEKELLFDSLNFNQYNQCENFAFICDISI